VVIFFFLSKTDGGLPTEIKRGTRLIHFTNIGAMMQSCKRRDKNDVTAQNRGKYAIIPQKSHYSQTVWTKKNLCDDDMTYRMTTRTLLL
jgi:hypothetical protein